MLRFRIVNLNKREKLPPPRVANKLTMSKIGMYFKDSYSELVHKVSWPTWSQLQNSAIIVMVASVIFAIVIFAMDITFRNLMEFLYKALY